MHPTRDGGDVDIATLLQDGSHGMRKAEICPSLPLELSHGPLKEHCTATTPEVDIAANSKGKGQSTIHYDRPPHLTVSASELLKAQLPAIKAIKWPQPLTLTS